MSARGLNTSCLCLRIAQIPAQEIPMTLETRCLIGLLALAVVDIVIPVPILGAILIYVVLQKPPWFEKLVHELYG